MQVIVPVYTPNIYANYWLVAVSCCERGLILLPITDILYFTDSEQLSDNQSDTTAILIIAVNACINLKTYSKYQQVKARRYRAHTNLYFIVHVIDNRFHFKYVEFWVRIYCYPYNIICNVCTWERDFATFA